jgi:hypothetical protein
VDKALVKKPKYGYNKNWREFMVAVRGFYDGNTVTVKQTIPVKEKCEVIITFLDASPGGVLTMAQKEKKRAALNRFIGLTADNPVSIEEAREERLSKQ